MIKNTNPFIVSGKIPTALFCDRKNETDSLLKFLQNEENVVYGPEDELIPQLAGDLMISDLRDAVECFRRAPVKEGVIL